jgi:hypothetical protein
MMTRTMLARLGRLEAASQPQSWRSWEGHPADEWPDEALEDFLRASIRRGGGTPPGAFTDEALHSIAAGALEVTA